MEEEIKIALVPKETINESVDFVRITCGDICVWGSTLEVAFKAFDIALMERN